MLSSLPKLADRTFIIGFFLPALLFGVALLRLFRDHEPSGAVWEGLKATEPRVAVFFLLAVWTASVVLSTVNLEIYKILEGYRWPVSALKSARARFREQLASKKREVDELRAAWKAQGNAFPAQKQERYGDLREELLTKYPERDTDVLPTRFGNAIRSFETYPRVIYGVDAVAVWPRLCVVIPKNVADQVSDARSQVDFFMNCCVLAGAVCVLAALRFACDTPLSLADGTTAGNRAFFSGLPYRWLIWTVAAAVISRAAYELAVARVLSWGSQVRSAFDCYLPSLATTLGFVLPPTYEARVQFWTSFSQMVLYGPEPGGRVPFQTRYQSK